MARAGSATAAPTPPSRRASTPAGCAARGATGTARSRVACRRGTRLRRTAGTAGNRRGRRRSPPRRRGGRGSRPTSGSGTRRCRSRRAYRPPPSRPRPAAHRGPAAATTAAAGLPRQSAFLPLFRPGPRGSGTRDRVGQWTRVVPQARTVVAEPVARLGQGGVPRARFGRGRRTTDGQQYPEP